LGGFGILSSPPGKRESDATSQNTCGGDQQSAPSLPKSPCNFSLRSKGRAGEAQLEPAAFACRRRHCFASLAMTKMAIPANGRLL